MTRIDDASVVPGASLRGPRLQPAKRDRSSTAALLQARRFTSALSRRHAETAAHVQRMRGYAARLSAELGWTAERSTRLSVAAALHDVGKLVLPPRLLSKPGPLSASERRTVERHTLLGAVLLSSVPAPWASLARSVALLHHERWDGRGYPRRLRRLDIPPAARIVAVADVYDALTHDRAYRRALPERRATQLMYAERGSHFDPEILECFLDLLPAMRQVSREADVLAAVR